MCPPVCNDLVMLRFQTENSSKGTQTLPARPPGTKPSTSSQISFLQRKGEELNDAFCCGLCLCWLTLQLSGSLHRQGLDGQAENNYQESVQSFPGTLHCQKLLYNIPSCFPKYLTDRTKLKKHGLWASRPLGSN